MIRTEGMTWREYDEMQAREAGIAVGEARGRAEGEARGRAEGEARGEARGRAEGEARGQENTWVAALKGIITSMKISFENAMEILKAPQSESAKFRQILITQGVIQA